MVGTSNPHPSQRSNYYYNLTHKMGGTRDTSASHCKTSDITCYKCGGKGHISPDPLCLQYDKPSTNPRFNAQRVIEGEDPQAEHHPILRMVMNWDSSIRILGEDHNMILKTKATTKTSWNTKRLFQKGRMMIMHQKQKKFACRPCELFEYLPSEELWRAT